MDENEKADRKPSLRQEWAHCDLSGYLLSYMIRLGEKLFIIGGWLGQGPLAADDLHVLDLEKLEWLALDIKVIHLLNVTSRELLRGLATCTQRIHTKIIFTCFVVEMVRTT